MPFYESVFIARQDISNTQVEALSDTFSDIIEKGGGNVTSKEQWGLRNLAYKIKKNRKGHYTLFNIDAPAAAILEMERNMRISEDILRYMTIRVDNLAVEPSIMMQRSRGPRDDDTRRGGRPGGDTGRGGNGRATEPKAETATETKAEPKAETATEPKAETKAETATEPEAEPKAEPEAKPEAEPKAEPVADAAGGDASGDAGGDKGDKS